MTIRYNITGKTRKALVLALEEQLHAPINYRGAPTFIFDVGEYSVDREGTLTGPDDRALVALLSEAHGFETAEAEYDATGEAAPQAADEAPAPEGDEVIIEYPHRDFTPEKLDNLFKMVEAKAPLLKKALGTDFLNITMDDTKLGFPWFRATEDNGQIDAYAQFIAALCQTALKKQRVTAKAPEFFENEKFSMRVWLISLGMVGPEYATARRELCKNLSGDSGWRYGKPAAVQGEIPAPEADAEEGESND